MRKLIPLIVVLACVAALTAGRATVARADVCGDDGTFPNCATQCAITGNDCDQPSDGDVDYGWICQVLGDDCPTDNSDQGSDDSGGGAPAPPAAAPAGTIAIYITDWPLFVWYDPSDGYYVPGWGDGEVVGCGGGCMTAPGLDGDVNYGECDNNTIVGICGEIDIGDASQLPGPLEGYLGQFAPQQEPGPVICGASSYLTGVSNRLQFGGGASCQSPYGMEIIHAAACLFSDSSVEPLSCSPSYSSNPEEIDLNVPPSYYLCGSGEVHAFLIVDVAGSATDQRGRTVEFDSDTPALDPRANLGVNC